MANILCNRNQCAIEHKKTKKLIDSLMCKPLFHTKTMSQQYICSPNQTTSKKTKKNPRNAKAKKTKIIKHARYTSKHVRRIPAINF
jgi:hypothetical protein